LAISELGIDLISLLIIIIIIINHHLPPPLLLLRRRRRFKSDRDEVWQGCSSRKYASTESDFLFDGHDVCPLLHAAAFVGCPLANRVHVTSFFYSS